MNPITWGSCMNSSCVRKWKEISMRPNYCDQHPSLVARMERIERLLYIVLGVALGSGVLQLSQVVG